MIKNPDKYAEYLVLTELLKKNIEAYPAISFNQEDYDITVVLSENLVVRVEVKSTGLQDKSTNNAIKNISSKNFNFLVLVVVDENQNRYFVLTKEEANNEMSLDPDQLYISRKDGEKFCVRENIAVHENQWDKITGCIRA